MKPLQFIRRLFFLISIFFFVSNHYSQIYTLNGASNNTTVSTCSGTFYDSGGDFFGYNSNEFYTITFCSNTPGTEIVFDFTSFDVETNWDALTVYNGPNIFSPQINGSPFDSGNPPGTISSDGTGCLTFTFSSDGSVALNGWEAVISCNTPSCNDGIQNQGETGIDCGGPCPNVCTDYLISQGGTITGCGGTLYDSGGQNGNYSNGENSTMTFCSSSGGIIALDFSAFTFEVETNFDFLNIYDGTNTTGTPMYQSSVTGGTTNPGIIASTGSCITVEFISDGSVNFSGWGAVINCPTCTDGIQNGNETDVDCGGPTCTPCPSCYDGIQNQNETGIDCGGICPTPCHCSNGIQDNGETGIDCGGPCPLSCPVPCDITATYNIIGGASQGGCCTYNLELSDLTGDGWGSGTAGNNDGTINVVINGVTFGPYWVATGSSFLNVPLNICDGESIELIYNQGNPFFGFEGDNSYELFDSQGNSIFSSGLAPANGSSFNGNAACFGGFSCAGGTVELIAQGQGEYSYVINNDFDAGGAGNGWNASPAATFTNPCDPSVDGGTYMWMGDNTSAPRTLETLPVDVSCGGEICFFIDFATQGNASPCEGPDLTDEGVYLQYSVDGGFTWVVIDYFDPTLGIYNAWSNFCYQIPQGAVSNGTIFQWSQTSASSNVNDHWGIDNVTITSLANCDPYIYDWAHVAGSPDDSTDIVTITQTTTYSVTYGNGVDVCTTDITVVVPDGPVITATTLADETCPGDCNGAASSVVTNGTGTPPYSYLWDNSAASTTTSINNLCAGDYVVTVTDDNNCTYNDTVTINSGVILNPVIDPVAAQCLNSNSFTFSSNNSSSSSGIITTYLWDFGDGSGTSSQANPSYSYNTAGTFTVTLTISDGNCTVNTTLDVNVWANPTTSTSITDETCNGDCDGSIDLTVLGSGGYTYSWDNGIGNIEDPTNLCANNYNLLLIDINGCQTSTSATVGSPTALGGSINAQTNVLCNADATGAVTVAGANGTAGYTYSLDGGTTTQISGTFNNLTAGAITVTVVDANGCTFDVPVTITEPAALGGSITAQTNVLCNADATGTVTVAGANGTAGYTYSLDGGTTTQASGTFNNLTAGAITVTVVDANGCTFDVPVTITEPAALGGSITAQTNVLCNGDATGAVTVAGANGTAGYTYSLDGGTTTQASGTFNNLTAGAITVTVVDANGCTFDVPVTITEPAALGGSITAQTNVLCNGDATGAVTVAGANGTAGYTYSLDGGTTTQISGTFNNLTAGAITVTVVDANGCSFDVPVNITEPAALGGSITAQTNVLCNADATGAVTVAGANGTAGYTYSLDGGTTTQISGTFNNLTAGAITVTVVDANGCTFDVPVTITEPAALGGSITAQTNVLCNADATGAVTVAGANGTAGYTYSLDGGTTTQISGTFNNLTAGAITVTVVDANGCTFDVPVTITEPAALGGSITAQTNVLCNADATGAVTVAGANGTAGYTYSLDGGTTTQASGTFNNLTAGAITVTVVDANGCTFDVPVTITEPTALGGSITAQTNVLCNGDATGAVTVAGANGTAGYTYSLDGGTTTQISGSFNNLTAGAITVTVVDANGCSFDVPVNITEPAALGGSITAQTNVLCNGDATGAVTVAGANGTAGYTYSLDGGTTTQISGTFNNLTAGAITVTVVDANGCTFDVPVTITEPAALGGSITAQTNVLCNADATGTVTVAGANGTAGYTYSLDGGTTTQASGTFNNLTAGAITVTVVDANGCSFDVPVTITEPAALGGSITAQTNVLCNADATGAVTVAGANGTAGYTYSLDGGTTTQASGTFNNLTAGAITVTVVDANGCSFDVPVTITEPAALGGSITAQTNVLCNADATGAVTVAGANGTAGYTYSLDGGTTTQISGTFNNLTAGAITVTVVDANGCTFDVPVTITEPAALGGSITAQTNVLCNADATGTVTVAGANGTAGYTYSLDGGTTTQASGTFNNLTAGAITVTVVDANGCTFDVPVTITEPAALGGSITAQTNVLCNADATGAVTVAGANGTAGYTYSLDGGTTTQVSGTFNNLTAGAITVTVVDANGCSFDIPVTITEPTALGGSITAQTNVLCNGDATGAVTVAGANGTAGYTYSLDGGTTTQISGTFNNLTAGAITVTVVDANGCTFDVPVTITEPAALGGSITAQTNVLCNADATGAVTVAGANGTAGYTYSLDGGTTTQISGTFNNLTAGAITVTVVDANGCTFDVPVTITEPNVLISSLVSTTDATCGSSNGDATVSASGGSGGIEFSIDGGTTFQANGTFSNLAPGTYTIIIEDDNGCQNQITATINDLSGINASITAQTNVLCNGDATGAVTVTASGSIAPYTYSDDGINFTTNNNFNGLNSGNYTITASDANGCEFPVNVTITEPAALGGSITAQTNVLCNGDATGAVTVAGANGTAGYTYSLDGGTTTQASGTFNNLTAGAITVTVVDANGCSFDVPVTITEPAALGGSITAQTNVLCNADATGAVTVAGANGTAGYTYSLDGGTTTQISGTFNNLTAGAITVTVVDANGCTFDVPVTITEPAALGGSITAQTNVLCNGDATGAVTVAGANGTAGYTYSLDGGTTTQASGTFNNLTAGAITVTVVDANGCTFDVPVTITEPAALAGSITAQTNVLCNADATGAVTVAGANGTAGYTYSLDGGTTTQVSGTFQQPYCWSNYCYCGGC